MSNLEILRTSTFRLASLSGGAFALCVAMLCALVYWQAATYETRQIDRFVEQRLRVIAAGDVDAAVAGLVRTESASGSGNGYFGLFAPNGTIIAGNLPAAPPGLALDGKARRFDEAGGSALGVPIRGAGLILPDGRKLILARDVASIDELRQALTRASEIGVLPALLLSLCVGFLLGWRAVRRVRAMRRTIERIMSGSLKDRLATTAADDDFDRLSRSVNRMLDEIERLLIEIEGIGDNIAHDLRTPLTRVRTRLERAKQPGTTREGLIDTIDAAIIGLDQALGIITALLRIAEIEDGRRRAAFGDVDLSALARDIAELYEPIAEGHGIALTIAANARVSVNGDRDLLIEAIANVIDNAIKFTPEGGAVAISTDEAGGQCVVRIADTGPGIPVEEREAVMKRFYRSDRSRHHFGSGLGLGLVHAIAKLHGFQVVIGDASPGCVVEFLCPPARGHTALARRRDLSGQRSNR
jgi:signal transduction histidine kinase